MIELKRYDLTCGDGGMYRDEAPKGEWVDAEQALAKIAALREERDQYKRLFNNAGDALCVIGEILGVPEDEQSSPATIEAATHAQQRLADAERRNAELVELLRELDENWNSHDGRDRFSLAMRKVEAALTQPEEAKS